MNLSQLTSEEKLLLSRFDDLLRIAEQGTPRFSIFLNERQCFIAESYLAHHGAKGLLFGGYDGAVRKMAGFFPPWQEPDLESFPVKTISLTLPKDATPSHRDYLGSLMSLHITRESIGDIVPNENRCAVFVNATVAPVILDELAKVGGWGVKCAEGIDGFVFPEAAFEPLRGTIASVRLDSLVKLITNSSREKAAQLIAAERVMLNYIVRKDSDARFAEKDILAIRGYGKFRVEQIGPVTKKGRLTIICAKYS